MLCTSKMGYLKKVVVIALLLLVLSGCSLRPQVAADSSTVPNDNSAVDAGSGALLHRSYIMEQEFYDRAYRTAGEAAPENVRAGIIPHHLLARYLIADFFQGLADRAAPSTVVLIGPNHREIGQTHAITSLVDWATPYGDLAINQAVVSELVARELVSIDERVMSEEHSISSDTPFIKKSFPGAKLVPIILKSTMAAGESDGLALALREVVPSDTLVLISVDFAHEVSPAEADALDRTSIAAFKLREGRAIGTMVTLRGERMWAFLDRLMNIVLPRVRDFRGVSAEAFDGRGNYTLGLREQIIFPEIDYDKVDKVRGMEITVVTTARSDDQAAKLLQLLGMPFRKD